VCMLEGGGLLNQSALFVLAVVRWFSLLFTYLSCGNASLFAPYWQAKGK
jgi:hypothetical protein